MTVADILGIYISGVLCFGLFVGITTSPKEIEKHALAVFALVAAWPIVAPVYLPLWLGGIVRWFWQAL